MSAAPPVPARIAPVARPRRLPLGPAGLAAAAWLLVIALAALVGPLLIAHDPDVQDLALGASAPSAEHWFGTDFEGRDLLARTLHGARVSLLVGLVATFVALVIGVLWGATAGYAGGRVDAVMMRVVDVLYGLPYMFFVIILMVWSGRSLINVFIGLGAVSWLTMARIVRGLTLSLREREFVLAARLSGASFARIVLTHIVPNALGTIAVYATLTVPRVIIEESFLSFLGLGVSPPAASWGSLIAEGAALFREYPWLLVAPATALATTLLALNVLGDALRDALDVRAERRA